MDILLTHGYFLAADAQESKVMKPYPPLGLLYISSYLKSKGFGVEVFDTTFSSRDLLKKYILKHQPPVVGIYCNLMTRRSVLDLTTFCKSNGCSVILGGPEPASYADEYLARGADIVVRGEGESTLEELLSRGVSRPVEELRRIAGIAFLDDEGALVQTEPRSHLRNLDAMPFPDRAAVDIGHYLKVWRDHHGRGPVSLITSRGCPFTCTWCSHSVFGFSHRQRSPQNVADEVELILQEYEPDMLWYSDDVFTINPRWLLAYAAELKGRGLDVPFETISREDRLDEEIVETLAAMQCHRLWIGAESGSQRVLDRMQRRTNAVRLGEVVRLLQRYGIEAGLFIMLGYEGETMDDIRATAEHLKQAKPDTFLSTIAYPIKGTPYYDEVAGRIVAAVPWDEGSDRLLTVAGRHSHRFYSFAARWMAGEVEYHQQRSGQDPSYLGMAKALVSAKVGRLGMMLTQHRRESCG